MVMLAKVDCFVLLIAARLTQAVLVGPATPKSGPAVPQMNVEELLNTEEQTRVLHKLEDIEHAEQGDAEHRGSPWYDFKHSSEISRERNQFEDETEEYASSLDISSERESKTSESKGSSKETKEVDRRHRLYRQCIPCPYDMMKKYTNLGIKWICGAYQRAHRSFKSECMMRFRNCQDGTMFVKIAEQRCKTDPFHGRHFFYLYGL